MKNIKDDLIVFGIGVIGFAITLFMKKFLYNINQASKIITFVVAMLSSLFVIGAAHHFCKNFTNSDYWKWKD
ncbi:hypothetical protein ABVN55_04285 [Fusobacterium animalis]|uniref:hypothetical protein n=1 Tax=Fusobacterium TaxID=848 RepID=UPI0003B8B916|nr:hypothetical protein [Fusobacterium nucleatum]ERT39000.1 hypothetical protein HMPREF1766_00253 [Fusobacterium nucleatum CTI-5]